MRPFFQLVYKEVRELLRLQYILPLILVPVVFIALGQGLGGIDEATAGQTAVGVVVNDTGEHAQTVVETYNQSGATEIVYSGERVNPTTALERTRSEGGTALVVVPDGFSERIAAGQQRGTVRLYSVVESVSLTGVVSASQVEGGLRAAGQRITMDVTGATPSQLNPIDTAYTTMVKGNEVSESPGTLGDVFFSQLLFVPIVIMLVIILAGQMVINSMGIEKENKTLETLLTMPVKRRTIVAAKLLGSALVGLAAAGIMTFAFVQYQSGITGGNGGGGLPAAFSLGALDLALVGVAIALAVVGGLALALVLGVFAGDRQGAQVLLLPLSVLAIAPAFATIFADFTTLSLPLQILLFLIPFTHPVIAYKQLLFGDPTIVYAGIAYEALFAVGAIALVVYIFSTDRVVTAGSSRLGRWLRKLQR